MKQKLMKVLMILLFVVGIGFFLYPVISEKWNDYVNAQLQTEYRESVNKMENSQLQELWAQAKEYNRHHTVNYTSDAFHKSALSTKEDKIYQSMLNPNHDGIMGQIVIPKIHITLPIYHGCTEEDLAVGVGHLEGSSLPIGTTSSHAVLAAHRGLADKKLFTDLDMLKEGDMFEIDVLDKKFMYEVDKISVVLPEELNEIQIEPDQDYVTLLTCTPFSVNTHRLLVRGKRIEDVQKFIAHHPDAQKEDTGMGMQTKLILYGFLFFVAVMILQTIWYRLRDKKQGRKRRRKRIVRRSTYERMINGK